jgi:uncharacterized membrane protein
MVSRRLILDSINNDIAKAVAIQSDGKIVVIVMRVTPLILLLHGYNSDGTLDATFSEDGKQTSLTGSANTVAIQNDGKIVVGGSNGYFVTLSVDLIPMEV